jgi:protocatechuate 3,4-dioxygenase beta subunit
MEWGSEWPRRLRLILILILIVPAAMLPPPCLCFVGSLLLNCIAPIWLSRCCKKRWRRLGSGSIFGFMKPNSEAASSRLFRERRAFLRAVALTSALWTVPGAFAEDLLRTPRQTEGPFYPDKLPLDTDNDLIIVNDRTTPALGEITHLSGRILDSRGSPLRNALVEIWQVDAKGVYINTHDQHASRDTNFQGFGRFLTGSTGEYYFRTIKPVVYPGRTRHIHFAVKLQGQEKWTTQCYVKGEPQNARDGVLNGIRDAKARESVIVDFAAIKGSAAGELAAKFDLVMGFTPQV